MSVLEGSGGGRGSQNQDFELNLASIIDCFTVLIAFMLASASFLAIGIMDAGVAAAGTESSSKTPPSVNVSVEIAKNMGFIVKVNGKATASYNLGAKDGTYDYVALTTQLAAIKSKWPDLSAVTLTAENTIQYKDVIKAMDVTRKTLPVVLLGGF